MASQFNFHDPLPTQTQTSAPIMSGTIIDEQKKFSLMELQFMYQTRRENRKSKNKWKRTLEKNFKKKMAKL